MVSDGAALGKEELAAAANLFSPSGRQPTREQNGHGASRINVTCVAGAPWPPPKACRQSEGPARCNQGAWRRPRLHKLSVGTAILAEGIFPQRQKTTLCRFLAQRSNPRPTRENRWERCQQERMLVSAGPRRRATSRNKPLPVLVRRPTLPCAPGKQRHARGTRQSRWSLIRSRRLCCESANDNSPLPAALVGFDLDQQRAFAIHLHLPR